jgi:uncharacterized protein (DUF1330 family)
MPAFVIANVTVTDPERYEEYKRLVPESIAAHGGKYLARGGGVQVLEGSWEPRRLVILEFPTAEQARAWWNSSAYAPAKAIRRATAQADLVLVEGVP